MNWKPLTYIVTAGVAVLTFLGGTAAYTYNALGNDAMPLEGKKQHAADYADLKDALMQAVLTLGNDMKADNLERRIESTCALLAAARDTKAATLAQGLDGQLAGYQAAHRQLTGAEYPVPMCQ